MWIDLKDETKATIVPNGLVIWYCGQVVNVPCAPEEAAKWIKERSI